jgi:hypothetical protein
VAHRIPGGFFGIDQSSKLGEQSLAFSLALPRWARSISELTEVGGPSAADSGILFVPSWIDLPQFSGARPEPYSSGAASIGSPKAGQGSEKRNFPIWSVIYCIK